MVVEEFQIANDTRGATLTFALDSGTDRSPRQSRHLSFIAEFTADIRHVKGTSNIVADMLTCRLD